MMARKKPVPAAIVASLQDADKVLEELAELERQASAISNSLNETIDVAKAFAAEDMAVIIARKNLLESALASYAVMNKAVLFRDKKSVDLDFGVLSFRSSTSIVTAGRNITWEMVLGKLKEYDLTEGISTKESVNKDVLREWDNDKLEKVGAKRKTEDKFGYDLKQHEPGLKQAV
jgi:phage host-nuclease inhibitor protein Gam